MPKHNLLASYAPVKCKKHKLKVLNPKITQIQKKYKDLKVFTSCSGA